MDDVQTEVTTKPAQRRNVRWPNVILVAMAAMTAASGYLMPTDYDACMAADGWCNGGILPTRILDTIAHAMVLTGGLAAYALARPANQDPAQVRRGIIIQGTWIASYGLLGIVAGALRFANEWESIVFAIAGLPAFVFGSFGIVLAPKLAVQDSPPEPQ